MKKIEKISKNIEKWFEKGKPLHPLYPLYDAIDTFLLTPKTTTKLGTHIKDAADMKRTMFMVIIAMIPATLFGMWNVGYQHYLSQGESVSLFTNFWYGLIKVLPIIIVTYISGLTVEIIFAKIRKHEVAEGFFVTGLLIPLVLPPEIPLWIVAIATAFSVLFSKEVFGGNGFNFLNPALVARAFIFFAYPKVITGDFVWISDKADVYSGATPLADFALENMSAIPSTLDMMIGTIPGSIGETSKIAILLGAFLLIFTGVGSLRIMLSVVAGGLGMGLLFNLIGGSPIMDFPAWQHLLMGGFLFGTVFMATDPVSAAHTKSGKIVYGVFVGMIAMLIRVVNKGYPEGMMLAILLGNIFAPLIDYCVVQIHIGRRKKAFLKTTNL
ncbi:MAG TPA: NADH:ubiquinone reductase (Na(+)-transporting) subunit B [Bacteroidales bacterium]|nr:NADH:ubiquinone reductase (Na(+)-transporting) subunit B [Bacteroidales bacterium]